MGILRLSLVSHSRYNFSLALDGFFPNKKGTNEDVIKKTLLGNLDSGMGFVEAFKEAMRVTVDAITRLVMAVWDKEEEKSLLLAAEMNGVSDPSIWLGARTASTLPLSLRLSMYWRIWVRCSLIGVM